MKEIIKKITDFLRLTNIQEDIKTIDKIKKLGTGVHACDNGYITIFFSYGYYSVFWTTDKETHNLLEGICVCVDFSEERIGLVYKKSLIQTFVEYDEKKRTDAISFIESKINSAYLKQTL